MASKTKDKYKKGDKVKYHIDYGASPMLAKSKAEKSKEKEGRVSKVTKDFTGKPQYLINNITIPHVNVVGLAENKQQGESVMNEENLNKKVFYIHDESGTLMDKVKGYKNALKATKSKNYPAQLNYLDGKEYVMVYAHISKGEKLIPSQMSSAMKRQNIKPNKEYVRENKTQGENTMKITKTQLVELIGEVLQEETEYQKYFKEKLAGRNLGDMSDEEKKAFFADIDKGWKGEKNETLEPVSPAAGNPLKRVKAKKRDQILAQEKVENYVRKLVREELKFVMFNEVPAGLSRKVTKKRISQTGSATKSL